MASAGGAQVPGFGGTLGVAKMIVVYGNFSTVTTHYWTRPRRVRATTPCLTWLRRAQVPFLVNAFLAWRVVYPSGGATRALSVAGLVTYVLCCIGNWGAPDSAEGR